MANDSSEFWSEFDSDRFSFEENGARAAGVVIERRAETGQSGRLPVLVLRTDDGDEKELWAGQFDLKQQLAKQRVDVGDRVTVELIGTKPTGRGNPMKLFKLTVEQGDGSFSWALPKREGRMPLPLTPICALSLAATHCAGRTCARASRP